MSFQYITNFEKSRKTQIGASDIPYLIPHPIKQIESLAAYTDDKGHRHANTALDLYNTKVNGEKSDYSFPADMGHYLEGKALFEFIKDNIGEKTATKFLRGYTLYNLEQQEKKINVDPEPFNNTPFKHNTEAVSTWGGIAHADCLYIPISEKGQKIVKNKLTIDLSKQFLIEAKSANFFAVRRKEDPYVGYDLDLHDWQGIPLKHYFQIQFQLLIYGVDVCYLTLIFNTSSKHYWQIKANKKHQEELKQLVMYMKKCIDNRTPPKELLMNSKDITALYPEIKEDFRELKDDELQAVIDLAGKYQEASGQEKLWKRRKDEYTEQIAIHLKDTELLKANIDGMFVDVAKWKETGGAERVIGLKDIGKREDGETVLAYLRKKELIKQDTKSRKPSIIIKKEYL